MTPPEESPASRTVNHRREHRPVDNLRLPQDTGRSPLLSRAVEPRRKCRAPHHERTLPVQVTGTGRSRGSPNQRKTGLSHFAANEF